MTGFDFGIIGGGIVGLAIGNALLKRHPDASVVVFEKESQVAHHASGRNSGVLHAGFYYSPDSLKARLTRDGNRRLREFCAEEGVEVRSCGKLVLATNEGQLPALEELARRGLVNGVELQRIDPSDARRIEPLANPAPAGALYSPTTAVADPVAVTLAMANRFQRLGGHLRVGAKVESVQPGTIRTTMERVNVGHTVNSAGLYADRIAHKFGVGTEYTMLPFKGLYWYAPTLRGTMRTHVYPVPNAANPFLGVHTTVTVHGDVKVGPTAIPVLGRENYAGLNGVNAGDLLTIFGDLLGLGRSEHHDMRALLRSELPKHLRRHLVAEARALVPSLRASDFRQRGLPGLRAQLFHRVERRLEMDFVVRQGERSTHVLNAVSPAWTSAISFADLVVSSIMNDNPTS